MIENMSGPVAFLIVWFTFLVITLIGVSAIIVWAVRSGQFANQDRARYLPLRSGIPEGTATALDEEHKEGSHVSS